MRLSRQSCVVTVDVGGTDITVSVFPDTNSPDTKLASFSLTKEKSEWHCANRAFFTDMEFIINRIRLVELRFGRVTAIAMAIAGKLNDSRTSLTMAGNLTSWVGRDATELLASYFPDARVVLGNDAEAAAMADAVYGLWAKDQELDGVPFIGLGWGSGVGGTYIRTLQSATSSVPIAHNPKTGRPLIMTIPGEPGPIYVGPDNGVACGCDEPGCLESYVGGNNLPKRFNGTKGDKLDQATYRDHVIPWMLLGLQSYLRVVPVNMVIYHGSVLCNQDWMVDYLEAGLKEMGFDVKFYKSWFGIEAGAVGALSLLSL
jgi:predicted NBD/HSP70 family sugar kinase